MNMTIYPSELGFFKFDLSMCFDALVEFSSGKGVFGFTLLIIILLFFYFYYLYPKKHDLKFDGLQRIFLILLYIKFIV